MSLTASQQASRWLIVLAIFLAIVFFIGDVLVPFVTGAAIAYFLDPIADYLERLGLKRVYCVAIIMLTAFFFIAMVAVLLVPLLINQFEGLVTNIPTYLEALNLFVRERFAGLFAENGVFLDALKSMQEQLQGVGLKVANSLLGSTLFVLDGLFFMFFVPVVTCYLLLDWDKIIAIVDGWLPRDHQKSIRKIFSDIDRVLASFVRGQITVCFILGAYYSLLLAVVGLNFGLLIGLIAGMVTFIPYLGALLGGSLAIGVALYQFWGDWSMVGAVVAIFISGQILEGNVITPKLVGKSVGLHPVWLLFSLSVFAKLFGFVGMLIAVPVAASIGVVGRFFVAKYKSSKLYLGAPELVKLEEKSPQDE